MAFTIGRTGPPLFGPVADATSKISLETGQDLEEVETDVVAFQSIAGDSRLRITPSWPSDAPPPPTASLLSVASQNGLLAAAGPASVIIASTESIRKAFSTTDSADGDTKPFTPQLVLNIGMRVSLIAFSADENRLVMSAESGGGLAVYNVQSLTAGNTQPEFELSTNGISLRCMLANPTPGMAELFAIVTTNGELMMANLNTRQFLNSAHGQIMKRDVSCISWSNRGSQLVAGLGNGACCQMTPEGEVQAEIPRPENLIGDQHVASIAWLENKVFLVNHTPSSFDPDGLPESTFRLITRPNQPPNSFINSFLFQKLPDPCLLGPAKRLPPSFYLHRIRNFQPNLQDIIVIASSASPDIGMLCRSKVPLTSALPAEKVTDVFVTAKMSNDARRASLPMLDFTDTSPVGLAFDFSSQEKVKRPLPGEEIEESPGPLPGLLALNNDGVLSFWWLVYADSVRQNTLSPGLVHKGTQELPRPLFDGKSTETTPSFGQTSFGDKFKAQNKGGFSEIPSVNAFVAPSVLGKLPSLWGGSNTATTANATPAFGQSGFASSPASGGGSQELKFGATAEMGSRGSPWGNSALGIGSARPGTQGGIPFMNTSSGSTFGSSSTGGFASFASAPGFAAAAAQRGADNTFMKAAPEASLSTGMDTDQSFGSMDQKANGTSTTLFSGEKFTLGSTFKGDGTAKSDLPKPDSSSSNSFFHGDFGKALEKNKAGGSTSPIQEAEMDDDSASNGSSEELHVVEDPIIPDAKPDQFKSQLPDTAPPIHGGFFGTQAQKSTTPATVQDSAPATNQDSASATSSSEKPAPSKTMPKETPEEPSELSRISVESLSSSKIKRESDEQLSLTKIPASVPEAPLPPESTSKTSYAVGDSSNSSKSSAEDAPLPPDFLPSKNKIKDLQPPADDAPPPPEDGSDEGLDDGEGSGVDVAQEISPITDSNQSPKITPESSFGTSFDKSPVGTLFNRASKQQPKQTSKNLFGEIGSTSFPLFPPPSKIQESPRSPSPIRMFMRDKQMSLRPDNSRSMSAPGHPVKPPTVRKPAPRQDINHSLFQSSLAQEQERERGLNATKKTSVFEVEQEEFSDREDEKIREELEADIEPTKTLEPFLAHQDYVANISKPGLLGQIETVYRDVNSMIDTLGLNARSLKSFIKGHTELYKEGGRLKEDLEEEDWCLIEIEDLGTIENKLSDQLKEAQVKNVQDKSDTCQGLRKDLHKVKSKRRELTNIIKPRSESQVPKAAKSVNLSTEQHAIQQDLRDQFQKIQKLIAEAEESISTLGVLISSSQTPNTKNSTSQKPTVEAVTNTIQKMTSMVEKKSFDIDILETKIKRLRLSSGSSSSSPFTKQNLNSRESSPRPFSASRFGSSAGKSGGGGANGVNTPSRKRMDDITDGEVRRLKARSKHRREVNALVKEAFLNGGPRVRGLE